MKVVHLYKDYFPPVRGGIEQTVERLARAQVAAGLEVTVVCSAHGDRRTTDEIVGGARVIRVAEWARFASAPLCPDMPRQIGRLKPDVWHLHFPNPTGEISWLMAAKGGAMVVSYHSDIVRQRAALRLYAPVVRQVLQRAGLILPTSQAYIDRSPFLREHLEKCVVVPLGIDLEAFAPGEERRQRARALRAGVRGPITLFIGRFRYYKGLHVLVNAMPNVEGTLVLVGDGPEAPGLRERVGQLGLGDRVLFAGPIDDEAMIDWIEAADVGVLPSTHHSEAFGIALLEMMAGGLPVISTELGTGTSFVNLNGETGQVVPPGDPAALAEGLRALQNDEGLRRRLGEAGRSRVRCMFSREAMAEGVARAYARVLGGEREAAGATPRHAGQGARS